MHRRRRRGARRSRRAGAGQMPIDLPPSRGHLFLDQQGQGGVFLMGRVGQDGQRGFQGMGQIPRLGPRLFQHLFL